MFFSRMYVKTCFDDRDNKITKIDFNTIEIDLLQKKWYKSRYKSAVSEEEIVRYIFMPKFIFYLTKMENNGMMFVYEMIEKKNENLEDVEKIFFKKVIKHFKRFSFLCKREMKKLLQMSKVFMGE